MIYKFQNDSTSSASSTSGLKVTYQFLIYVQNILASDRNKKINLLDTDNLCAEF